MTVIAENRTAQGPSEEPPAARNGLWRWENLVLLGILVGAALLYGWALGDRVFQPYYAAAVRSMSRSGTAFLYAGYDQAGVVTIDKPPLAFWVQTLGVWIFGYHWWAIALVQAIEGVAAVFVLHRVVRRWAGEPTALLAAALLATTPILTAIDRDNVSDTLLVLLLVIGAYCVTRAVERGGTGWLVAAGAVVGLAFLAKMLAGWMVLPGFAIAYLCAAPVGIGKRLWQLGLAGVATLVVSLWWPVLVALSPNHPFVGSTSNGSIWQLIFVYNGFGRLFGTSTSSLGAAGAIIGQSFGGPPGALRLFNGEIGGQIAWLLPVSLIALIGALVVGLRGHWGTSGQRGGWLLWGGWLVVAGAAFSFTGGVFHPYYTAELAAPVAALAAAGLVASWRWYREGRWSGLLFPAALAVTAMTALAILNRSASWLPWLRIAIVVAAAVAVVALVVAFPRWRAGVGSAVLIPVLAVGFLAMLAGPAAYAIDTVGRPQNVFSAGDPTAGPNGSSLNALLSTVSAVAGGPGLEARAYAGFMQQAYVLNPGQRELLSYVLAHDDGAAIALAVEGGSYGADPYLINTTASVATLGGYVGFDPSPTVAQLSQWVAAHRLRFVVVPAGFLAVAKAATVAARAAARSGATSGGSAGGSAGASGSAGGGANPISERLAWVATHCGEVPPSEIGPAAAGAGLVFDCQRPPTR